jgi:hypothetical protein
MWLPLRSPEQETIMSTYRVWQIAYDSKGRDGLCVVAVSAETRYRAISRLKGNRPADIIFARVIPGREPEYEQDRIEGTCHMNDPMKPPPQAGTIDAEAIRAANQEILRHKRF